MFLGNVKINLRKSENNQGKKIIIAKFLRKCVNELGKNSQYIQKIKKSWQ
jgi:hypothetical protein